MTGAAGDLDSFNWVAANPAGLTLAFVDVSKSQIGSERAVWMNIVLRAGAAVLER